MKFLHTGDLHLDSPFCALGAKDAERQRELGRELLKRIFECAAQEGCELILMSGDVFDGRIVTPETAELFCSLIEKYNIYTVVSPGNHDPYFDGCFYEKAVQRVGDKLFVFSTEELQIFDIDELRIRIFGYAFRSRFLDTNPLSSSILPEDNGYVRLFCGHCDVDTPLSRTAPITLKELKSFSFDYAALGHIHNKWSEELGEGRIRYCGFGEGRSFDELGEGGVFIVDIADGECRCERKILSERAFYMLEVEASADDDKGSLVRKISESVQGNGLGKGAYLRITLEGYADEDAIASVMMGSRELSTALGVEYIELIDRTVPMLDGEYLEKDTTLRGEFYRLLKPALMSTDAEERDKALKALKIGLAAIDGRSIFGAGEGGGK